MMKTAIKLFSALVLSVGFSACGGQELAEGQTVDESGNVVESVEQALTSGYCRVDYTLKLTGYCTASVNGFVVQQSLTTVCAPGSLAKGLIGTWPNSSIRYDKGSPCSF